ncbi:MAG: L,D-transpeptidase [Actinobacteria bacterium]|nr:L,D-transpeptidase [Actinomycetota bacterium]
MNCSRHSKTTPSIFPAARHTASHLIIIMLLSSLLATGTLVFNTGKAVCDTALETSPGGPNPPAGIETIYREEDLGLRVTLSWNHIESSTGGYRVYRAVRLEGPYEPVGGVSSSTMTGFPFFLDDTVEGGVKYYYKVSSVDAEWREGPMSAPVIAEPPRYYRACSVQKSMTVSLTDQLVYCYENGVCVNILRCSTGAGGTPTGNYHIYAHHRSMGAGNCVCDYWMDWKPNYGMHSWPRWSDGYRDYEENLGVNPRSHGCIRLHPLEAYWPYNWAPDGTPLTIVPYSVGGTPLRGTHSSTGTTTLSKVWYFAEGYTDAQFAEYLLLFNPGNEPANAKTTYFPPGNPQVIENYHLEPGVRQTIFVNNVSGLPQSTGHSIKVESDLGIAVQQSHYFNYGGNRRGGHSSPGATEASRQWYFAEGYTGALFDTYLLVFNPNKEDAVINVEYMVESEPPRVYSNAIPPETRGSFLVNAFPEASGKSLSMKVMSEVPVIAQRSEYFAWPGNPNGINGGNTALGTEKPSKTWYLAEGCTGHFFDEYILLQNPGDEVANVYLEFCPETGPYGHQVALPPKSRGTLSVDCIPGIENADTPAIIISDKDIVVEMAMYNARDSRRGGDLSEGIRELSKEWFFPEGYTGGSFDEYLLLFNPSGEAAAVNIFFHPENAAVVGASYAIPPKRKLSVHVDEIAGVEWNSSAVEIHADKPIAAEQAHYFCIPR